MPNPPNLEEIERLIEAATDGPWEYEDDKEGSSMGWIVGPPKQRPDHSYPLPGDTLFHVCSAQQAINAEFLVALRNEAPALIAALREAREVLAETQQIVAEFASSGFTDEQIGMRLFENQARIHAALTGAKS